MVRQTRLLPLTAVHMHLEALDTSSRLTTYFRQKHQPMATLITPEGVIEILNRAGVRPVLMGTHGLGGWRSEARATQDVDVLVRKKELRKAIRSLQAAFPELIINDFPVVTRFIDPATQKAVIDVMKPTQEVFRVVFRHTIAVGDTHEIPDLEMALASKFAAMVSPNRNQAKKHVDIGDFIDVVLHNSDKLDLPKLRRLGDKTYPNGGAEIIQLIDDIRAGRPIYL